MRTEGGVFERGAELDAYLEYHEEQRKYHLAAWLLRRDPEARQLFLARYLRRFPEEKRAEVREELNVYREIVLMDWQLAADSEGR